MLGQNWELYLAAAGTLLTAGAVHQLLFSSSRPARAAKGLRVVCISDTHGRHRDLVLPPGDILVHAGDFTHFGKEEDAVDFNAWLGEQTGFKHIVVVNGNHEHNAEWKRRTAQILSNATFLCDGMTSLELLHRPSKQEAPVRLKIFGTQFLWPLAASGGVNPYELIPSDVDLVVAHGPPEGINDDGHGCAHLAKAMMKLRPHAVISGHIHQAHGVQTVGGVQFVNAANCGKGYTITNSPIVIDI